MGGGETGLVSCTRRAEKDSRPLFPMKVLTPVRTRHSGMTVPRYNFPAPAPTLNRHPSSFPITRPPKWTLPCVLCPIRHAPLRCASHLAHGPRFITVGSSKAGGLRRLPTADYSAVCSLYNLWRQKQRSLCCALVVYKQRR